MPINTKFDSGFCDVDSWPLKDTQGPPVHVTQATKQAPDGDNIWMLLL